MTEGDLSESAVWTTGSFTYPDVIVCIFFKIFGGLSKRMSGSIHTVMLSGSTCAQWRKNIVV